MTNFDELKNIIDRIENKNNTEADVAALRRFLNTREQKVLQLGSKFNINIGQGQNFHIGDCFYQEWNENAVQAFIKFIREGKLDSNWKEYYTLQDSCNDQNLLDEYLESRVKILRENGFLSIQKNVFYDGKVFKCVAKRTNFDISIGFVPMRGEAFFVFSEFLSIDKESLRQFSDTCFKYVRVEAQSSTTLQTIYDFRIPSNILFSIAIVDYVNEETRMHIQKSNPFRDTVNPLWYKMPIIYELSKNKLYLYNKPSNPLKFFGGEVVWNKLRKIVKDFLMP